MIVHKDVIQGSEAWQNLRVGKPTASRFSDIITAVKGDLSKSCTGYMLELIGSCFCPEYAEFTGNKWTERGLELEPEALEAFTIHTGHKVEKVGFITRDDGIVGCSPDAMVVEDTRYIAGIELKCPAPKTHIGYILEGVLPNDYRQQVHGGMAVTGLSRWEFFSYFPGMKPFHVTVHRDDYTEKLSDSLDQFLIDYAAMRAAVIPKVQLPKPPPDSPLM